MDEHRLDETWAVITGGSKGIGLGIATAFVRQGANVVLVARTRADLDAAQSQLRREAAGPQQVEIRVADIGDEVSVRELFADLAEATPGLSTIVANAGTGSVTSLLDLTIDDWDRIVRINLRGTFLIVQSAARLMKDRPLPNQSMIVVSSVRATQFRPGTLPYSCSKAALNQLVRGAALELAPHRIRVNGLSPGMTMTPLLLANTADAERSAAARTPLGRAGQPTDMANAAAFLASRSAEFITGANLVVDGGESLT
jgi:3-oxoacyl-[acyl-carrier protein] reductase